MNLIKLTRFTGDINANDVESKEFETYINIELIDAITDTDNGTLVYLNKPLNWQNAKKGISAEFKVTETAEEIHNMISRITTDKAMEKIQDQMYQTADAISKDWVEGFGDDPKKYAFTEEDKIKYGAKYKK